MSLPTLKTKIVLRKPENLTFLANNKQTEIYIIMNLITKLTHTYCWFSQQNVDPNLYFLPQPNIPNCYVFPPSLTLHLVWLTFYLIPSRNKGKFCKSQAGHWKSKMNVGLGVCSTEEPSGDAWLLPDLALSTCMTMRESSSLLSWFPYQHGFLYLKGDIVRLEWGNVQIMYMNMFWKIESAI